MLCTNCVVMSDLQTNTLYEKEPITIISLCFINPHLLGCALVFAGFLAGGRAGLLGHVLEE